MKEYETDISFLKKEDLLCKQSYEKPLMNKVNLFADQVLSSCNLPLPDGDCGDISQLSI